MNPFGKIVKGKRKREWMDLTNQKFAYRCLPMIMANELGWDVCSETSFQAVWDGGEGVNSVSIKFLEPDNPSNSQVLSHFGYGVLTFHLGFLFRTTPNVNMYVKGIPNQIKDAVQPLEGLIETDWLPFTFTMNWKFTRPNVPIEFRVGEPIARVLPYPRGFIESFETSLSVLNEDASLGQEVEEWVADRKELSKQLSNGNAKKKADGSYFKGLKKNRKRVVNHQSKIELKEFV